VRSILFGGVLTFLVGAVILVAVPRVQVSDRPLRSLAFLFGLLVVASLNYELQIFEQKAASEIAFEIHQAGAYLTDLPSFALQAIVNAPAFELSGSWEAAIGTNAGLAALIFFACDVRDRRAIAFILTPAVINFSMFALRDPLIGVTMFLFTLTALQSSGRRRTLGLIAVAVATYFTRAENLIIELVAVSLILYRGSKKWTVRTFTVPGIFVALFGALRFGPRLLGVQGSYTVSQAPLILENFFERRANRGSIEAGNTSAILGGRLPSMAFPIRFPVQLVAFLILPLPFEIRTLPLLLAAVDSIILLWLLHRRRHLVHRDALLIAAVFVAISALFASNYGNSFRLRLPVYYILAAGALQGSLEDAKFSAKEAASKQPSNEQPHAAR